MNYLHKIHSLWDPGQEPRQFPDITTNEFSNQSLFPTYRSEVYVCAESLRHVWLDATPWTIACQVPLSMGLSWQEHRNGLPCAPPRDTTNPGTEPASPVSLAPAGGFSPTSATWEAPTTVYYPHVVYVLPCNVSTIKFRNHSLRLWQRYRIRLSYHRVTKSHPFHQLCILLLNVQTQRHLFIIDITEFIQNISKHNSLRFLKEGLSDNDIMSKKILKRVLQKNVN